MKKFLAVVLAAVCLISSAVLSVSAITKADQPITGGNTKFFQAEMMYTGEPTASSAWSNAFTNDDWTGCRWTAATEDGIDCIKLVPVTGNSAEHFMDFNWYQWNNDKYYPSLDCSQYKFIKVKYKFNDAAANAVGASKFWASQDSPILTKTLGTGTVEFDLPHTADKWETLIVDLSGIDLVKDSTSVKWTDATIRQFRYYPFGSATELPSDAVCYIEYIAFFETKADAEAFMSPSEEAAAAAEAAENAAAAADKTADPMPALVVFAVSASMSLAFVASRKNRKH